MSDYATSTERIEGLEESNLRYRNALREIADRACQHCSSCERAMRVLGWTYMPNGKIGVPGTLSIPAGLGPLLEGRLRALAADLGAGFEIRDSE